MKEKKGYVFYDKNKKRWYARTTVTDENGKRRNVKRTAKNKTEAKNLLKTLIYKLMEKERKQLTN